MRKRRHSLCQQAPSMWGHGFLLGMVLSAPSYGQSSASSLSQDEANDDGDATYVLDHMQVGTGTRLPQVDFEGSVPITVVDRADIERIGLNDLAEVIRQLPSITGSPVSTRTNNGGDGGSAVDIRGLGTIRTLVLVNGRRDISGGDLSVIPLSIVERIDVLKEGASAIYGADAVAGVVNIITRQNFRGAELLANYGRSLELIDNPVADELNDGRLNGSRGDAKRISLILGDSSARSGFVLGLEYNEQDPVFQGNIDNPQFQRTLQLNDIDDYRLAGLGALNRDIDGDGQIGITTQGSTRSLGGFFEVGDEIYTRDTVTGELRPFDSCGDELTCGGDLYNFAPVNYIQTPFERTNLFVQGDYNLFDGVNAYVEARYSNRRSSQFLAPLPYDSQIDPAAELANGEQGIPASNVYNPFGEDLSIVRRRISEAGGRNFSNEVNQIQINTGLRGRLGSWAPTWAWDLTWQWGRRSQVDSNEGQFVGSRLAQALGPSFFDADGIARCGTPDEIIDGCVPLNLFGGLGSITQDQIDYVAATLNDHAIAKRQVLNASLDGVVLELPAGPLSAAVGYEFRKDEFSFIPDSGKSSGAVTGNLSGFTDGEYSVNSLFAEVHIPVLSSIPGVELLELSAGFRYDDYSTIGDTGNVQAAIRWQPISSLLIRGSYSEVFREPSVIELFASESDDFPSFQDVCSTAVLGQSDTNLYASLTPEQQARCHATGVPVGGFVQNDAQVRIQNRGTEDLHAETGETFTIGLAWSPEFIHGFSFTADYWDVEISNAITSVAGGSVISQCVIANDSEACGRISRFADGNVDFVFSPTVNIGAETASGVDLSFNYEGNSSWGIFDARILVTYLKERRSTEINTINAAGRFENRNGLARGVYPKWKGTFNLDWRYENWGASLNVDYIGGVDEFDTDALNALQPDQSEDEAFIQRVGAEWYVDVVGRYHFGSNTEFSAGLTNVFDNKPPYISGEFNASTDTDTYRLLGRSWFAQIRHQF